MIEGAGELGRGKRWENPFGDGRTGEKIVQLAGKQQGFNSLQMLRASLAR